MVYNIYIQDENNILRSHFESLSWMNVKNIKPINYNIQTYN